jgi:AraC-like DNA-binding protein
MDSDGLQEALYAVEKKLFSQQLSSLIAALKPDRRLERAYSVIAENYSDSTLNLDRVAKAAGVSRNHLNLLLRLTTGFTFHQLLVRYRLFKAVHGMSRRNRRTAIDLALEVGFGSLWAFERNFRKILGASPTYFQNVTLGSKNRDFRGDSAP